MVPFDGGYLERAEDLGINSVILTPPDRVNSYGGTALRKGLLGRALTALDLFGGGVNTSRSLYRVARSQYRVVCGSVGGSYDNVLPETIVGLYKTEVIRYRGPWRNLEHVEFNTRVAGLV